MAKRGSVAANTKEGLKRNPMKAKTWWQGFGRGEDVQDMLRDARNVITKCGVPAGDNVLCVGEC